MAPAHSAPERSFVNGRYGQMHLRRADPATGGATPVVCLHMFPQSGRNFEALLPLLGRHRTAIAPDFPGYGESTPPPQPIAAADYAAAIWDVVDALDLCGEHGQVHLFGIHAGAKLATEVARQRPDAVGRIILSSAAVLTEAELDALKQAFTPIPLDHAGTRFARLWDLLNRNRGTGVTLEMQAISFAEMLRGGEAYEWGHDAVFEYNRVFPAAIAELAHEITLLNPGDDLYAMTPRTLAHIRNGELHDRPEWQHGFLEVHAQAVAALIEDRLTAPPRTANPIPEEAQCLPT
ncbi:MAG: alpha/beta fold hydrolase [Pseudomonadota bacterium]